MQFPNAQRKDKVNNVTLVIIPAENEQIVKITITFASMKLLSFILSLYIFSLVTAPVFGMLDLLPESLCCQDFCSTENEQEQHNDQDNGGCTEICNPFLSCQCGFGFIAPYINNSLKTFSPFKAKNREYKQSFSFQYFHTIWHPPKA